MKPFIIHHSSFIIHKAFSLVEIMFAVMILGIGFIMIAAMFPVAIQQSQATVVETTGTIVAESAMRTLKACPAAWYTNSINWTAVRLGSQQISAADPQFGYIAFARQSPTLGAGYHDLLTIAVQARNTSALVTNSYDLWPHATPPAPASHVGMISSLSLRSNDFGTVTFASDAGQAVEGAYVLAYVFSGPASDGVFQLGTLTDPATNTWSVLPVPAGSSLDGVGGMNLPVFIIGRGLRNPALVYDLATNPYEGPSIAVHASPIAMVSK